MPFSKNEVSVLIVDDERIIRESLGEYLEEEGFEVGSAGTGEDALQKLGDRYYDFLICDINLPGIDGIEVLQRTQKLSPETFVILITAYATVETAVEAFQRGAQDYLMKPILFDEVTEKLRRLLRYRNLKQENLSLRRELNREEVENIVVGTNAAVLSCFNMSDKLAPTSTTILITGESGTGKEVLARYIHNRSQNENDEGRFQTISCASMPAESMEAQLFGYKKGALPHADKDFKGLFSQAGKGTIFLDEIAELPLALQAKLLRVIEAKEFLPIGATQAIKLQARIIAATNKDLAKEVETGRFRNDLLYRLNGVTLRLPPLRDRKEDIPYLVDHFLQKHSKRLNRRLPGVTHEAMHVLRHHPWRGNIRELENTMERALILTDNEWITPADLPPELDSRAVDPNILDDLNKAMEHYEKMHIERILKQTQDKRETAKRLNIGLSSLYRKIELLGIELKGS